jgi:CBS domain-containing protein
MAVRRSEAKRRSIKEPRFRPPKPPYKPVEEGEIMRFARSPVVTVTPTTPIREAIAVMTKAGFRRLPVVEPGTLKLRGIVTAMDIIDYLGGGSKFEIVQKRFLGDFFKAVHAPTDLLMTTNVVSVPTSAKISQTIEVMAENNLGGLPVTDGQNRVRAIVTERDIAFLLSDRLSRVTVAEVMSKRPVTTSPETPIRFVEIIMVQNGFRRLPLVARDELVGIVTAMDIVRFFGTSQVFEHLKSGLMDQVLETKVGEIATHGVHSISPEADLGAAAQAMESHNIGALPVLKEGKLVGIVTERDFFKLLT